MDQNNLLSDPDPPADYGWAGKSYLTTGKILMISIVVLLFVVASMLLLHIYARWYLLRARRRQLRLGPRTHFVFRFEDGAHHPAQLGLDPDVIRSLPVFVHSPGANPDPVECAVCLSEFEEGETGRVLPKCNHCFHIECIDMWFHSHSTCPLCRALVELPVNPGPVETGSSSGPRKPVVGITLEVPTRRFDEDSVVSTPTQFRSPLGRMLSFTRMLSRERRTESPSPSSSFVPGGGYLPVVDIEQGKDEAGPVG